MAEECRQITSVVPSDMKKDSMEKEARVNL